MSVGVGVSVGVPDLNPASGEGARAVTVSFVDSEVNANDLTTYTFSGVVLGAAAADRRIVVGVGHRGTLARTIVSVTIGGIAADAIVQVVSGASDLNRVALFWAAVPTGTTGDVVVTLSGSAVRLGICAWALMGAASVVDTGSAIVDPATDTINVPLRGGIVGYAFATDTGVARTVTWTGMSEDVDEVVETFTTQHAAHAVSAAGEALAVSCDWNTAPATAMGAVFASFGP
jgi:hypothetical protein